MNIKKLDKVFSEYIRRRDAYQGNDYCKCCTCRNELHWKDMDAGHYISRGNLSTRWHEQNVHAQCPSCNRLKDGDFDSYKYFLETQYVWDVVEELERLSKEIYKPMQFEIDELTEYYKDKIKQL